MTVMQPLGLAEPLPASRLAAAKRGFATRRIALPAAAALVTAGAPQAGDLVLARVEEIGHHAKLELPSGRRAALWPGDEVLLVYAARYAPDQFEAVVPDDLGRCDLVAAGGIAGRVLSRAERARRPTRLSPLGLVATPAGRRLSTHDFALAPQPGQRPSQGPPVVAVLGSSMNAGKTTTMAAMIRGEARAGRRVGAAKVTGTGSGGDLWSYLDAGAAVALDFTDAGLPSTCGVEPSRIAAAFETLLALLGEAELDVAVIEVADGLLYGETAALIREPAFRQRVDGVVFAAADAMGALGGAAFLAREGLAPLALSGQVTRAPLALREVRQGTELPVLTVAEMQDGVWLPSDALARRRVEAA